MASSLGILEGPGEMRVIEWKKGCRKMKYSIKNRPKVSSNESEALGILGHGGSGLTECLAEVRLQAPENTAELLQNLQPVCSQKTAELSELLQSSSPSALLGL